MTEGRAESGVTDTASTASPVSNPEDTGIGGQEEDQPSQDVAKQDPDKPKEEKRETMEKWGTGRKLDPAD